MTSLIVLALFVILFVAGHLALSAVRVRGRLVEALGGESRFLAVYSTFALLTFIGMVLAYGQAPRPVLWQLPLWANWLPVLVMPVALLMVVWGVTAPNPAAVRQGATATAVGKPKGFTAVTRHPFMWGFALWALVHMAVNGDLASQILMGGVLALALLGTFHIDARRRALLGKDWQGFSDATSWLPFWAMIRGRARFHWRDIGLWRVGVALALYAALLVAHPWIFGVSPLPW